MRVTCLIILCFLASGLSGQDNLQVQFGYRGSLAAARQLPSTHKMDSAKFEVNIAYNIWEATQSITYQSVKTITGDNRITSEEIDQIISQMDEDNRIAMGQDFLILGFGFKHQLAGKPLVWELSVSDRLNMNAYYPKTLAQFIWKGNKQFEGSTVDFSSTFATGLYLREIALGAARTIYESDSWAISAGIRFKYFMGLTGLSNSSSRFDLTTSTGAQSIQMDYDYEYYYAGMDDFSLVSPKGHGYGFDLGFSFSYKSKWNFDLGLTDMGSISFTKNVKELSSIGDFEFKGFNRQALIDLETSIDSLVSFLDADVSEAKEFRMNIGTKLSFMASYTFARKIAWGSERRLFLFYRQGFAEAPGVTQTPKLSLAYNQVALKFLNIGMSTSWGGFNNFAVGILLGMKFKHFQFGFHSDDFTGLIAPEHATGAGGGFLLRLEF